MAEPAKVGTFCPNPVCPDYEQVQENDGDTGHDFLPSPHTDDKEILECLGMIAEGFAGRQRQPCERT